MIVMLMAIGDDHDWMVIDDDDVGEGYDNDWW